MSRPVLRQVNSFSLDIDDWYSCTSSDDEAYQEALERNSSASFYTARGAGSSSASIVFASAALGSPARLADADRALEEMVPEPLSDPTFQGRTPPELDEQDAPMSKRARGLSPTVASRPANPPAKSKALSKAAACRSESGWSTIKYAPGATANWQAAASESHLTAPAAPLRVSLHVQPDGSTVRLQVSPAVFCFGNVTVPAPIAYTDYSAMLLGPEGGLQAENSAFADDDLLLSPSQAPSCTSAQPLDARKRLASEGSSAASPEANGLQDIAPFKDPVTPKDQTKTIRRAVTKERKAGFPGASIFQRLFSGLRSSGGGANPQLPPVTVQELGSELLLASAAKAPAGIEMAIAAAQQAPVFAGFVHASSSGAVAASEAGSGVLDEAAAAAQRLSADIFRNVLRASAGGAPEAGAPSPKPVVMSPRDTTFPPTEAATPQRDQVAVPVATGTESKPCTSAVASPATPTRHIPESDSASPQHATDDKQSSPGMAALALLVGLAADAVPGDAASSGPAEPVPEVDGQQSGLGDVEAPVSGHAADRDGTDTALSPAGDAVEGVELPTPELEQCDSPVTSKSTAASPRCNGTEASLVLGQTAAVATVQRGDAAEATMSPRTISKKAYGTIARLVKKIAPNFRDSAVKSVMSIDTSVGLQPSVAAAEPAQQAFSFVPGPSSALKASPSSTAVKDSAQEGSRPVFDSTALPWGSVSVSAAAGSVQEQEQTEEATKAEAPEDVAPAPTMFVFGQHHPANDSATKPASATKPLTGGKSRAGASRGSASAAASSTPTADASTRKRKADLEILPTAKMPLLGEDTPDALQPEADGRADSGSTKCQPVPLTRQDEVSAATAEPTCQSVLPADDGAAAMPSPASAREYAFSTGQHQATSSSSRKDSPPPSPSAMGRNESNEKDTGAPLAPQLSGGDDALSGHAEPVPLPVVLGEVTEPTSVAGPAAGTDESLAEREADGAVVASGTLEDNTQQPASSSANQEPLAPEPLSPAAVVLSNVGGPTSSPGSLASEMANNPVCKEALAVPQPNLTDVAGAAQEVDTRVDASSGAPRGQLDDARPASCDTEPAGQGRSAVLAATASEQDTPSRQKTAQSEVAIVEVKRDEAATTVVSGSAPSPMKDLAAAGSQVARIESAQAADTVGESENIAGQQQGELPAKKSSKGKWLTELFSCLRG